MSSPERNPASPEQAEQAEQAKAADQPEGAAADGKNVEWADGDRPDGAWHDDADGWAGPDSMPPQPAEQVAAPPPEPAPAPEAADDDDDDEKKRGRRRSKTIARKQMLRERRRMLAQGTIPEIIEYDRPNTRAECRDAKRPCLYVSCRYHLYLDVNPVTGSIKLNFPDKQPWQLAETCALDVAERGGITLEEVGEIMNLTRERIRQVEVSGLEKLKEGDDSLHTFVDGRELEPPPSEKE